MWLFSPFYASGREINAASREILRVRVNARHIMDFIYDACTVYTRRFVCGRYPHKINSKFIVYTHTLHIYRYNKYNIIVIINGGKMMIGSIDECTIIEITVNLKNIKKNVTCIFILYSMFIL